jgi:hypothetical protein
MDKSIGFLVTRAAKAFGHMFMLGRTATPALVELDRPSNSESMVKSRMIAVFQYRKIFDAIVQRISVDVVNVFSRVKRPDLCLGNIAVLIHPLAISKLELPILQSSHSMQTPGTNRYGTGMPHSFKGLFESSHSQKRVTYPAEALFALTRIVEGLSIFPSLANNWFATNSTEFFKMLHTNTEYKASA